MPPPQSSATLVLITDASAALGLPSSVAPLVTHAPAPTGAHASSTTHVSIVTAPPVANTPPPHTSATPPVIVVRSTTTACAPASAYKPPPSDAHPPSRWTLSMKAGAFAYTLPPRPAPSFATLSLNTAPEPAPSSAPVSFDGVDAVPCTIAPAPSGAELSCTTVLCSSTWPPMPTHKPPPLLVPWLASMVESTNEAKAEEPSTAAPPPRLAVFSLSTIPVKTRLLVPTTAMPPPTPPEPRLMVSPVTVDASLLKRMPCPRPAQSRMVLTAPSAPKMWTLASSSSWSQLSAYGYVPG
mmetsp:Transcript_15932/g.55480  ORF Transcript_15932/g.55480 Transcript_15932/m.55480 type:complete len:296 (-) Transcript_15932:10462-11349(-)